MEYLTFEKFKEIAEANPGPHWNGYRSRWKYYRRAVQVARSLNIDSPDSVLEMGTMGANVVLNSITIDYDKNWHFDGKNPDFIHDARDLPWPIPNKKFKLFIALRVFQHLTPVQKQCFDEARRIAENIIIVTPTKYNNQGGITQSDFILWNNGRWPTLIERVMDNNTYLYLWCKSDIE